jgi:hypothetical protein
MTHAEDAARLATEIEKSNPAFAGVIHALLALAESGNRNSGWQLLKEFEDLPWQVEQDYIFEYADGEQVKWRLSADNPSRVYEYYSPHDRSLRVDPNKLVDDCTRWRWA